MNPFPALAGRALRAATLALIATVAIAALTFAQTPTRMSDGPASVVPRSAADVRLDARTRGEILAALYDQMNLHYVEADTARMIVAYLQKQAKAGAYDRLVGAPEFGEAVTRDLRKVNGDLHLSLRFDPEGAGGGGGPRLVRRTVGGPGGPGAAPTDAPQGGPGGGPMIVRRVEGGPGAPAGGSGDPNAAPPSFLERGAREKNFGFGKLEILPGNIGYMEITGFLEAPGMEDVMVDALKFLERTDAIIIDVRRNGGGSGNMTHLMYSHFLTGQPVQTVKVKSREPELNRTMETFADVPGPRRPDVPLFVLTSRNTGSAAEEFSFVLKNLGRATVIGDRTAGAGHMVNRYDLPHGWVAGVSITRVSDPRTGVEFEAIGVQPNIKVAPEHALAMAHALALRGKAKKSNERDAVKLEMLAEWIEARDRGTPPDAAALRTVPGQFEGDRSVTAENGRLIYRRNRGMSEELIPLGDNRFALLGEARLTFSDAALTVERADGTKGTYPRLLTNTSQIRD